MRDVYAIFGTLLAIGIAVPGLLTACWLLFPQWVEKSAENLHSHTRSTFLIGLISTTIVTLFALVLANLPLPLAQFIAAGSGLVAVAISAIGSAGIVLHMARRLQTHSELSLSAAFLRAALAFTLAAIFPLVGWLLIAPICLVMSFGAALSVWRRRRVSEPTTTEPPLSIEI